MWTGGFLLVGMKTEDAFQLSLRGTGECQVGRRAVYVIEHVPATVQDRFQLLLDCPQMTKGLSGKCSI